MEEHLLLCNCDPQGVMWQANRSHHAPAKKLLRCLFLCVVKHVCAMAEPCWEYFARCLGWIWFVACYCCTCLCAPCMFSPCLALILCLASHACYGLVFVWWFLCCACRSSWRLVHAYAENCVLSYVCIASLQDRKNRPALLFELPFAEKEFKALSPITALHTSGGTVRCAYCVECWCVRVGPACCGLAMWMCC